MLRHNLLLTYRSFKRFKSTFFINLVGLSTGLACALLIYLWVRDELNVDKFNEKDSQLFQVMKTSPNADGTISTLEYTPGLLAQSLANEIPEVEYAVSVIPWDKMGIVSVGDKHLKAKHVFADQDYFQVFSHRLLQGDKSKVLADKHGVLLSDKLALKLFNTTKNIVGKTVVWERGDQLNGSYVVSGVFEAPPANATIQFDLLFKYELYYENNLQDMAFWGSNNPYTYVILKKGTNLKQFNEKIRDFTKSKIKALYGISSSMLRWEGDLFLQRYSDRYLYNHYENGVQAGGRIEYVRLFSVIALFILIIACVNFMNLSTAKASRRMKELGIKKAIGATRTSLIIQHLGESMLMAFLSLLMALLLIYLVLPPFKEITGKELTLSLEPTLILAVSGITLLTGLISGSYPALYLSGFSPAMVLKGSATLGKLPTSASDAWTRRGLVIFQFTISVILIVSVLVVRQQIEFIHAKNLGYNKDHIIQFSNEGKLRNNLATFLTEVKKMPGVVNASSMGGNLVGIHGGGSGIDWEGKLPGEGIEFSRIYADYDFIETMGMEMAEGRSYSRNFGADSSKVIFNEAAIAAMRLKNPVGKTVKLWGKEKQIIGVVKDFHFESLYERVKPFFFECTENNDNVLVNIKAGRERETIEQIQQFYQAYNQGLPFDYHFLDEDYQALYASEQRVAVLSKYFAGIAILISCLGLFGLAAFTAERRRKEIGIRKVLGASELGIVYLLSSDFTKLVVASIVIALPLGYLIVRHWLDSFAYRIALEGWYFMGAGLVALLIAWLTMGTQAVKAARINPVQCLREE